MGTLQKAIIAGGVLLALHTYRVQATCAVVVGTSDPYGVECGTPFTQVERNTTLHLKKLQTYTKDGCIVGLKTQFGYKAGEAKLLGSSAGAERTLALGDSEYINGVDIGENATCINFLRFTTGKGQNLAVGGGAGALVTKPRTDAYVFGFAGTAGGNCAHGIGQLQFIWAVEDCSRSLLGAQVNPNPTQNPTPNPSAPPEEQPGRPVPVDIPVPNLVPTPTPIPVPVFNVSVPVPVPVPVPTPINVTIPQYDLKVINVSVPIPVPVPTPVDVPNPVPVPVPTPINVTIPVPTPVPVPVPTPIPIPTPVPVQTPAPVTNVQVQVPNAPVGTMANVAAICDVNQDLMVFTSSSSLRCVFDYAGAPTGRVVTSGSSRFAQYANVLCFDLGCQQVPVPAPASIMSYGKSGGFEVMTGDSGSYRSYGGSGMWNNYNTYMAHGRRRMHGWNPFAKMLEKDEEITIQITKNKPEPPAAPEPKPVYVPVPVPVRVPVQMAPVRNLMVARCSFAICVPKAGQQQLQWQQQQVVQQQAVQQQAQQWQQQQQWGAGGSVDSVDDDNDDMQMYANNNNMRTMG